MTDKAKSFILANATLTAAQIVALNVAIRTPKTAEVRYATLASDDGGWGRDRAGQFRAELRLLQKSDDPATAAMGDSFIALIDGGFNPADPGVTSAVAQLIGAGLCTQAEADKVLVDISYPAGVETLVESDVQTLLDAIAVQNAMLAREAKIVSGYNAAMALNQGGELDMTVIQAAFDGALS